jgi:hypothetical protein
MEYDPDKETWHPICLGWPESALVGWLMLHQAHLEHLWNDKGPTEEALQLLLAGQRSPDALDPDHWTVLLAVHAYHDATVAGPSLHDLLNLQGPLSYPVAHWMAACMTGTLDAWIDEQLHRRH